MLSTDDSGWGSNPKHARVFGSALPSVGTKLALSQSQVASFLRLQHEYYTNRRFSAIFHKGWVTILTRFVLIRVCLRFPNRFSRLTVVWAASRGSWRRRTRLVWLQFLPRREPWIRKR